ncbi:MAG: hypothetical protein JSW03_02595 [Candidatus Eiseniibacteriota bacterium]|nr:MAG: hypothetical protein JSW03_02595 [Candidatus Eisenbacteria bacterium]
MKQALNSSSKKGRGNIVLVGVAGVGKTTLGDIASRELGMRFVDVDMAFEAAEHADIDTLLGRYGQEGFDNKLLGFFHKVIIGSSDTILAAPARLTHFRPFWTVIRTNGFSIHLRGKPSEIYKRQEVWVDERRLTDAEKEEDCWKKDFADYHRWRVRHCGKADYTVRIVGDREIDAGELCKIILRVVYCEE